MRQWVMKKWFDSFALVRRGVRREVMTTRLFHSPFSTTAERMQTEDDLAKDDVKKRCLFVIGGTGVGKTKLGVHLALALNGEVVNSDAMQIYKGLPIATAQPTGEERQGVTHHLMGVLDVKDAWTVRDYRDHALKCMEDIWNRGKVPIVVGGTLYYVQSLIWKSLLDEQPGFESIYQRQQQQQQEQSESKRAKGDITSTEYASEAPFERLKRLDPVRAGQLHPNDTRKIERSLEVLEETGKRHGEETSRHHQSQPTEDVTGDPPEVRVDCRVLWLTCENDQGQLDSRLRTRVEQMMKNGLPEEADSFMKEHVGEDLEQHKKGVFQAIGFRELSEVIADPQNESKIQACVDSLVIKHRQYVKSQLKWIRNRILIRTVPVHALDATDLTQWSDKVLRPALEISQRYLRGDDPVSVERDYPLSNVVEYVPKDTKTARTCEMCGGRTLVGDEQWEKHVRGRSHRKSLERHKKLERNEQERIARLTQSAVESAAGKEQDTTELDSTTQPPPPRGIEDQ